MSLDIELFYENVDKYFGTTGANKEIRLKLIDESNEKELIYNLKIGFNSSEILKYNVEVTVENSYGNKVKLSQIIKYNKENENFFVEQEEIE